MTHHDSAHPPTPSLPSLNGSDGGEEEKEEGRERRREGGRGRGREGGREGEGGRESNSNQTHINFVHNILVWSLL